MKYIKLMCLMFVLVSITVCASELPTECERDIKQIETEYAEVIKDIFGQVRNRLTAGEDIIDIAWLGGKNKAEFKTIKHLTSDLNIVVCFDQQAKKIIREKIKESLRNTINGEMDKICVIKDIKAETIEDFFYVSGLVCGLALESGEWCENMVGSFKKENRVFLKKLKIIEKANNKIKEIERKGEKEEKKRTLYEHIVMGTVPR